LAIPAEVTVLLPDELARVTLEGVSKEVSIALVDVAVGDYVIVHVGFALSKIDPKEARQTLALLAEAAALVEVGQRNTSTNTATVVYAPHGEGYRPCR
jgi:hydrogenase expression/formation protein HypC